MKLYAHQQDAVEETLGALAFGSESINIEAPTSFGKSLVIAELAKQLDTNVVILVNIGELINQIAEHLDEIGADYSILKAGRDNLFDPKKKIQIVMSQTFYARREKINLIGEYIIQDEGHKEYDTDRTKAIVKALKPKGIVRTTATPYDQLGFALPGSEIIRTITVRELTEQGYLSPIKYIIPKWAQKVDYSSVKKTGADYSTSQLEEITNKTGHMQQAIDSIKELKMQSEKGIVFCSSIEQADMFAELMRKNKIFAESYHSETKDQEAKMTAFKTGENRILKNPLAEDDSLFNKEEMHVQGDQVHWIVSVSKLSIGFSVKDIKCMLSLRPTKVRSLFIQMVGRGCRIHPSKDFTYYIDCAQNVSTHGLHYEDYVPPERTYTEEDRNRILEATKELVMEDLASILEDNLTELTREQYVIKLQELKEKLKKKPSTMTIKELGTSYEISKDIEEIIAIGAEIMTRKFGRPISKAGREYDYSPDWLAETYYDAFNQFPEMEKRWTKATKTRIRNIIKEEKNFNAVRFFIEFLVQKHEEEMVSIVDEYRKPEPEIKIDDIDDDDIPF